MLASKDKDGTVVYKGHFLPFIFLQRWWIDYMRCQLSDKDFGTDRLAAYKIPEWFVIMSIVKITKSITY